MTIEHYPIDRCTTMQLLTGFVCNCGRTVLGPTYCLIHFGKNIDELEQELQGRENELT